MWCIHFIDDTFRDLYFSDYYQAEECFIYIAKACIELKKKHEITPEYYECDSWDELLKFWNNEKNIDEFVEMYEIEVEGDDWRDELSWLK